MQRFLSVYVVLKVAPCWEEREAADCQRHTVPRRWHENSVYVLNKAFQMVIKQSLYLLRTNLQACYKETNHLFASW